MQFTQFRPCRNAVFKLSWRNWVKCIVLYLFKQINRWTGKDRMKPRALGLLGHSELRDTCVIWFYRSSDALDGKFIVYGSQLQELFNLCPQCQGLCTIRSSVVGSLLSVLQDCTCGHRRRWYSQPFIGTYPAGNLEISAAILFSGTCSHVSRSSYLLVLTKMKWKIMAAFRGMQRIACET